MVERMLPSSLAPPQEEGSQKLLSQRGSGHGLSGGFTGNLEVSWLLFDGSLLAEEQGWFAPGTELRCIDQE